MNWRTLLSVVLVVSSSSLVGCAGDADDSSIEAPAGESADEIRAGSKTIEGRFEAGGITGFQIVEQQGPEDHNTVAVDLSGHDAPGDRLVGKTLRVRGKIELRQVGTLPNGTQIRREVMIAKELVEKTNERVSLKGSLERRGTGFVVVERTPENAAPEDQDTNETALELGNGVEPSSLVGKKVKVDGQRAFVIVGAVGGVAGGSFLIQRELVLAATIVRN